MWFYLFKMIFWFCLIFIFKQRHMLFTLLFNKIDKYIYHNFFLYIQLVIVFLFCLSTWLVIFTDEFIKFESSC